MVLNIPDEWFEDVIDRPLTEAERRKLIDDPKFAKDFFNEVIQGTSKNHEHAWFLLDRWLDLRAKSNEQSKEN